MRLNIYHTNDIHSNFSFLSRVCGYLEQYRQEEDLYLDSGDFLDLKSILVQADRGAGALKLLKLCGLEAMALGNNELDFGCPDLEKLMAYPLLCANLTRADGTPVRGLQSHRIVERLGKRFLIIGLAPYFGEGMVPSLYNLFFEMGDLHTVDPVPAVTKILEENRGSYDFSILLSHSGHPVDRELEKRLPPVDLWLEGHSHAVITEERHSQSGMGQLLGRGVRPGGRWRLVRGLRHRQSGAVRFHGQSPALPAGVPLRSDGHHRLCRRGHRGAGGAAVYPG